MKVQWTSLADEVRGHVDQRHYARRIPGNGEYGAVCAKPELSKKTKKAKAEHPISIRWRLMEDRWRYVGNSDKPLERENK